MDCSDGAKDSGIGVVSFRELGSMHDLVLHLKVCHVVSLETYVIDIMYMITDDDSALEIQQKAHHSCIYYIQSYCAI